MKRNDNHDEFLAESDLLAQILGDHHDLIVEYQRLCPELCKRAGYGPEDHTEEFRPGYTGLALGDGRCMEVPEEEVESPEEFEKRTGVNWEQWQERVAQAKARKSS
jgi:hypothetical protein